MTYLEQVQRFSDLHLFYYRSILHHQGGEVREIPGLKQAIYISTIRRPTSGQYLTSSARDSAILPGSRRLCLQVTSTLYEG